MSKHPMVIIISVVMGFVVMCGLAFWLGQQQEKRSSSGVSIPVKRFRAKEGTERKNARALTSSIPSPETDRSREPVEVWGSLDKPDDATSPSREDASVRSALEASSPAAGIQELLERLAFADEEDVTSIERAALAYLYTRLDPPDTERAEALFAQAWNTGNTRESQVEVIYFVSKAALEQGQYREVFSALQRLGTEQLPASGYALELGIMAGIAYEGLGDTDAARTAYTHTMEQAKGIGLDANHQVRNAYRMAGLRLGMLHRSAGETRQAATLGKTVSRLARKP
jgi:tetratricopeptide (TPR) repeat protein